jgi:hypothetical protein
MTHIDRINSIRPAAAAHPGHFGAIKILNSSLAIAALILVMYYVMQVNVLAASAWRLRDARERLGAAKQERNELVARQAKMDDRTALSEVAAAEGMELAGAVVYLVQPDAMTAVR